GAAARAEGALMRAVTSIAVTAVVVCLPAAVQAAGWTATPLMTTARWSHTATLLLDGRELVAGGTAVAASGSAEIYDPRTGAWTRTKADMPTPHSDHVAA